MKSTFAVGALALACAIPAFPCSICRCGDPTFNALGKPGVAQTGLRVALDWDQVDKTQGSTGEDNLDELREQRTTALFAYGFSDRFSLYARIPFSTRRLVETADGESERTNTSGLADPEIYGQLKLWGSSFEGDVGIRTSLYAIGGVKTPWGQNNLQGDGGRLDEHAQTGTGSTDWFGGLAGSHQINPHSALFASVQYRVTGHNDEGYRYGRTALVNLAYEYKLSGRWDAVVEANYRHAGRDQFRGESGSGIEKDPDTGGSIFYATPRLLFDAGKGVVLRAAAQIPLGQSGLNGHQHESPVFNLGVTWTPPQQK